VNCSESINICIVPIVLRQRILESCSQGTFIDESLLKLLSVPSVKTNLTSMAIVGQKTFSSNLVSCLSVKCVYGNFSEQINFASSYSRANIDVRNNAMATAKSLSSWSYLQGIEDELGKRELDDNRRLSKGFRTFQGYPKSKYRSLCLLDIIEMVYRRSK